MLLKNLFTTPEQSQRLKELGVRQDANAHWIKGPNEYWHTLPEMHNWHLHVGPIAHHHQGQPGWEVLAAFTAEEMAILLEPFDVYDFALPPKVVALADFFIFVYRLHTGGDTGQMRENNDRLGPAIDPINPKINPLQCTTSQK